MRRQHLALSILLTATLCVGGAGAYLDYHGSSNKVENQLSASVADLATAEARLDTDTLRVGSLQLQHYDGVVQSEAGLKAEAETLRRQLADVHFLGDSLMEKTTTYYLDTLSRNVNLLERIKGEAAFLRNQVSYIPFAAKEAGETLSLDSRVRLLEISQQMLAYHASPTHAEADRLDVLMKRMAATSGLSAQETALLLHVRAYYEQRQQMMLALSAYAELDQPGWRTLLGTQLSADMERAHDQARLITSLLGLCAVGLLAALIWSISLLNNARRQAVLSSETLTSAIESMAGAFALFDANYRLVLFNRHYLNLYQPAIKLLKPGMPYQDFAHFLAGCGALDESLCKPDHLLQTALDHLGLPMSMVLPIKGGRWYKCTHTVTPSGGFICYTTDETETMSAEERMRRLITAVEQCPASIVITDTRGVIDYVNPWFTQITGYDRNEVIGQNPRILKSGNTRDADYVELWQTISGGQVWTGELCNRKKSGDLYWESASISPVRDESGRITCYVGVKRDITEEKENAVQFEKTLNELARSNAELEQFAYVASHDLREPLRMVSSYVSLLARRYADKLDGDAIEFITFAKDGARRMDRLILDLLDYSRIGRITQPVGPVDLNVCVDEARHNLEALIADTQANVHCTGPLPIVLAAPNEIPRLMQNLIGNAVKYRSPDRTPDVEISARFEDDAWVICISDNGIGIAPEYYERIFGIFQRLHAQGEYEGTGIGLAICRKIVQHNGGRIWIESSPGQGSRFFFTLPKVS